VLSSCERHRQQQQQQQCPCCLAAFWVASSLPRRLLSRHSHLGRHLTRHPTDLQQQQQQQQQKQQQQQNRVRPVWVTESAGK
jgi:hypothetical protein